MSPYFRGWFLHKSILLGPQKLSSLALQRCPFKAGSQYDTEPGQILHSIPASVDTGPVLEWSLDRLLKATKYSFSIAATTEVGKGSTYSISVWTYDDGNV